MISVPNLWLMLALVVVSPLAAAAWSYGEEKDPMGRGAIKWAINISTNIVNLNFPYQGSQRAKLQVYIHPQYGRNVTLEIQRGQFMCRRDQCSVLVRFDERAPVRYSSIGPSDNSSNLIFINDYASFLRGLRGAKVVRIEAEFFQQGMKIFEFDVAGLKWDEPASGKATAQKAESVVPSETRAEQPAKFSERMKECNSKAGDLKYKDRENFIRDCLREMRGEKRQETQ